jgi:hypothetical protein
MKRKNIRTQIADLFSDKEDPNEIGYDPSHLGSVVIVSIVGIGALYWLLWTLLVFEGGIFRKINAVLSVLFTNKTLQDIGYIGAPYQMGALEGWVGNVVALILTASLAYAATRLYRDAAKNNKRKK